MFLQIPAMLIIAKAVRNRMPKLAVWTYICMGLSALSLIVLVIGICTGIDAAPAIWIRVALDGCVGVYFMEGGIDKCYVMGFDPGVNFVSAYYPETRVKAAVCSNHEDGAYEVLSAIEEALE
ncbi:hypothetical protein [Salinicoccus halodurans]|nr:hypothetical protein [Salinicoccus halodurans]